jgi:hypothetical protein
MTLRRLNLKIQGYPESYASEPYAGDNMVFAEARAGPPPENNLHGRMRPEDAQIPPADALERPMSGSPMSIVQHSGPSPHRGSPSNSMRNSPHRASPQSVHSSPRGSPSLLSGPRSSPPMVYDAGVGDGDVTLAVADAAPSDIMTEQV